LFIEEFAISLTYFFAQYKQRICHENNYNYVFLYFFIIIIYLFNLNSFVGEGVLVKTIPVCGGKGVVCQKNRLDTKMLTVHFYSFFTIQTPPV